MRAKQFFRDYLPAIATFLILFAFALQIFREYQSVAKARTDMEFNYRATEAVETIHKRLMDYIQILRGSQGLFYASDSVTEANWRLYFDNLDLENNYPGIYAYAFAAFIDKSEILVLERQMKTSGHSEFRVTSANVNQKLLPITYIQPLSEQNQRVLGYDMYSEPIRRASIDRALLTGEAAMSGKVILVQDRDINDQPGFLVYMPVYRNQASVKTVEDRKNNIAGFVYIPFKAPVFMEVATERFNDLHISIYDGDSLKPENILYRSDTTLVATELSNGKQSEMVLDTLISPAGGQWRMVMSPSNDFNASINMRQPAFVLIIGLMITLLMTGVSVTIINNRKKADYKLILSKEIEKKKDEFIGIASHELNTPLTSIKAYMQILQTVELKEAERNFVKKALGQINKLQNIVKDLLDVSKINGDGLQLNLMVFPLVDLVQESIEIVEHIYAKAKIGLTEQVPDISIYADKIRLEQVITNLLTNAIKYSPDIPNVTITVKIIENVLQITVRDTGIGISKENQKRLFEKFYRADSLNSAFSGLGMGLFVANDIVKKHNGHIKVSSELGIGSVFTIELPCVEKG